MTQSEKDRTAASVMGDLLVSIARRERLKQLVGEIHASGGESAITRLLNEFEALVVREHRNLMLPPPTPPVPDLGLAPEELKLDVDTSLGASAKPAPPTPPREPQREEAPPAPLPEQGPSPEAQAEPAEPAGDLPDRRVIPEEVFEEQPAPPKPSHARIPVEVSDEDVLYVHGVSVVPLDEKPEHRPFMLEEKGIDNREFAFALDRGGLRFFLSRVDTRAMSVSKSGVLLLNKQESLRLRGVHAGIINDLRAHGMLLPFEFGTVVQGKADLFEKVDEHVFELQDAVDDLLATQWWHVSAFMLDAKLAQILGSESAGPRRDRDRRDTAYSPTHAGKVDIKMLERVLGRQKKIAESIHEELSALADRSELETVVGFSSGTSDDWKLILKASYLVPPSRVQKLSTTVTDLQYRYFLFELMLSLTGDTASFSLQKK